MKKLLIGLVTAGLLLLAANSVIGSTLRSPAEIFQDTDIREEFRAQMLEDKKAFIQDKVAAGELTQEEADSIIADIENNQAYCGGAGFGRGNFDGQERPEGYFGQGRGYGRGSCWGAGGTNLQ